MLSLERSWAGLGAPLGVPGCLLGRQGRPRSEKTVKRAEVEIIEKPLDFIVFSILGGAEGEVEAQLKLQTSKSLPPSSENEVLAEPRMRLKRT